MNDTQPQAIADPSQDLADNAMNRDTVWGVAVATLPAIALFLIALQAHADSVRSVRPCICDYIYPGIYDQIFPQSFEDGAKDFYLKEIAANDQRSKILAAAKDECGGRYQGTSIHLTELSHEINLDRNFSGGDQLQHATATVHWLLVETISCSFRIGDSQSLLHAVLLSGNESAQLTIHYVNGEVSGNPVVSNVKRTYTFGADQYQDQYKMPYGKSP